MPDGNLLLFPELASAAPTRASAPPDATARAAALDVRRSFVVEAPAGSGKTGLLIQRYLKLLGDPSVSTPEQVLAITFTNKAAGELRDRVLVYLAAARACTPAQDDFAQATRVFASAVLERDRELNWRLLEQPHRLNLRTIDSISAEIARSLPVLSGSGGAMKPTEHAEPLFRQAARRTLLLLGNTAADAEPELDRAIRDLLLHRDANLADCETLLADMLAVRDQWASLVPLDRANLTDEVLDRDVLRRLQLALEQAICTGLTRICDEFPSELLSDLADLAGHFGHAPPLDSDVSLLAPCAGVHRSLRATAEDRDRWAALAHLLLTKGGTWRKERGITGSNLGFEYNRKHSHHNRLARVLDALGEREDLREELVRVAKLPPAKYPSNQWAVTKSLFRVLRRALIELQLVFAEHATCDFNELSLVARGALRSGSGAHDLASARGARLQHLLVDEMQDTSSGQYELIQLLTESWDGHSQTVFLVGDPRQSIYLFRQARVERFLRTLRARQIGELPLTALRLTANFRSQRGLVEQFNEDFRRIFPAPAPGTDAAGGFEYKNADAVLPASRNAGGREWHAKPVALPQPAEDAAQREGPTNAQLRQLQSRRNATAIRRIVQRWRDKPLPPTRKLLPSGEPEPWRLAVLVRNRSHLLEVVAALRAESVPFRAVDIEPLNERQEILDLTALTRALLHPADRVASLALLRAPWCGLSLSDLHMLTGADDAGFSKHSVQRLMEERGDLLTADACVRMRRLWTTLAAAADQRGRLTTAQLVERTWRSLGGDAPLGPDHRINARRYFELLDEIELASGATLDFALLSRRLQRLYAEPQTIPPGMPVVELLTMHGAKGLEWDAVLIPALERRAAQGRARLLTWAELDPSGDASPVMFAPIAARGEEVDMLTAWLKSVHRDHEAWERKRLFYVAATRAREELHLFASPDLTAQGQIRTSWDSLLQSAWPAAEPYFSGAIEQTATEPATHAKLRESVGIDLAAAASVHPMPKRNGTNGVAPPAEPLRESPPEAAQAELYRAPAHPPIQRLAAAFDPAARFAAARTHRLPYGSGTSGSSEGVLESAIRDVTRPQGSFAARAFGNTVHALLELCASRIAGGTTCAELLTEASQWNTRIAALLRSSGLPPAEIDRLTRDARTAVERLLQDRDGAWLLSRHIGAASELGITAHLPADTHGPGALTSVRVDRIFRAGPEPCAAGDSFLWIIDYKTASHGPGGVAEFLAAERATYAPQLETYARILAQAQGVAEDQIRLGLYYPMLPRLVWW